MSKPSATNWERFDAMTDDDIDFSDIPELTDEELAQMTVWFPPTPMVRVDRDVLVWFAARGENVERQINMILRNYVAAHSAVGT